MEYFSFYFYYFGFIQKDYLLIRLILKYNYTSFSNDFKHSYFMEKSLNTNCFIIYSVRKFLKNNWNALEKLNILP